jgi:endonuclease YncB( thermonuclease family)
MKLRIKTFLALLVLLLPCPQLLGQEPIIRAQVKGISDGDTIRVLVAPNQMKRIRLAWIDSPEKGQAFGNRAKQAMSELVFGKEVELRTMAWINTDAHWLRYSSTATMSVWSR